MAVSVTTTGNGKFSNTADQSDVIISYSISEGATPTSLADMSGEIPVLTITGESNNISTSGSTHPASKLLVDNSLTMTDNLRGSFTGRVSSLTGDSQSVTLQVVSIFEKLNTTKKVQSHSGTITSAIQAYMAVAGIAPGNYSIDSSFNTQNVVFPGWTDNMWNALKMLCVAVNAEMYFQSTILYFKPRGTKTFTLENIDGESFSVNLGQETKTTTFTLSKTTAVNNAIVYAKAPKESSEDIDYNEIKQVSLTSKVAIDSINQPEYAQSPFSSYVDYIQPKSVGTVPTQYTNGFYSFRNKQGSIVPESLAAAFGASVKAELTDDPYEILITITGPTIAYNTPWSLEFRDDYPTLALTGSGVLVETQDVSFATGTSVGDENNEYTNNPFLVNNSYLQNTAYYTNQEICGPIVKFSFATDKIESAGGQEFGYLPGAIFSYGGSKYRIVSASYEHGSVSVDAKQYVTFADFNTLWAGKTFAQFNSTMLDPITYPNEYMKYSDLTILPLMEPTA